MKKSYEGVLVEIIFAVDILTSSLSIGDGNNYLGGDEIPTIGGIGELD